MKLVTRLERPEPFKVHYVSMSKEEAAQLLEMLQSCSGGDLRPGEVLGNIQLRSTFGRNWDWHIEVVP